MPVISMFYGIVVRMYRELGGKHKEPHIHVAYAGEEVVVSLAGVIMEGNIPKHKMKLLEAWMEIHREELIADWEMLSAGEQCYKIEPLR